MDSNNTKGCVTFILVLSVILAIAGAAVAYYYYSIGDLTIPGVSNSAQNCGCYYTYTDGSCNSATGALIFKPGTVDSAGKCVASCPTPSSDPSLSGMSCEFNGKPTAGACSKTCSTGLEQKIVNGFDDTQSVCLCCKSQELKACNQINLKSELLCKNISLTTKDGTLLIPPIDPNTPVKITATFDDTKEYSDFVFKVNGTELPEDSTIPGDCSQSCTKDETGIHPYIIINPLDYTTDISISLQISVDGVHAGTIKNLDTTPCTRTYLLKVDERPNCASISVISRENAGEFTVDAISLKANSLPASLTNLKSKFTFNPIQNGITTLTTKDSTSLLIDNEIILETDTLNSANTFSESKPFPIVNANTTLQTNIMYDLEGATETLICDDYVFVSGKSDGNTDNTGGNDTSANIDNTDVIVDNGTSAPTGAISDFVVAKTGNLCVERVNPLNVSTFAISITNRSSVPDILESVVDKLPLGFIYQPGSTKINNVVKSDTGLVTAVMVGNSQEITWKQATNFEFNNGEVMQITFSAVAGSQAITGQNSNEVVIKPVNTPRTPTDLRTSFTFNVAQTCGTPKTGLFDNTKSKLFAGIAVLFIGLLFSFSGIGEKLSLKIAGSGLIEKSASNMKELKSELFVRNYSFEKKVINDKKKTNRSKVK